MYNNKTTNSIPTTILLASIRIRIKIKIIVIYSKKTYLKKRRPIALRIVAVRWRCPPQWHPSLLKSLHAGSTKSESRSASWPTSARVPMWAASGCPVWAAPCSSTATTYSICTSSSTSASFSSLNSLSCWSHRSVQI